MSIKDKICWKTGHEFSIDDENFVIDITSGKDRRQTDEEGYTLVKTKDFLNLYFDLVPRVPKGGGVIELGIFQGGSFVLLDKLFEPAAMSAVEIDKDPIVPLTGYCESATDRNLNTYYGSSQGDRALLEKIVDEDLNGSLDLVVDDASHRYDLTAQSFEVLFPKMKPGGLYVIEDWAWAHTPAHDSGRHGWKVDPSLTKLIFELVINLGLRNSIHSVEIYRELAIIQKGTTPGQPMPVMNPKMRGKALPRSL